MLATRFTKLVGCTVPIQQAGMGAASPPELAAAVSEAGGLGMLGTARGGINPTTLPACSHGCELTNRSFGVNFIPRHYPGMMREFIEQAAKVSRVVECFYTEPDPEFVRIVHDHGALASWQVGSAEEALKAAEVGCDLIVAQGAEAGGHVRGTTGLLDLLCEVIEAVPEIPVLAAGASAGRAMAAALAAGADGVRVGTRFVASEEADAHPTWTAALIAAQAKDSVDTRTFHVGWPEAPHGVLRCAIDAAEAYKGETVGKVVRLDGTQFAVPRFSATVPDRTATGHVEAMCLYAGQSVGGVKRVMPAREIVEELVEEAEASCSVPTEHGGPVRAGAPSRRAIRWVRRPGLPAAGDRRILPAAGRKRWSTVTPAARSAST
jgi:NAD(P)H-dependent flavin oxidoreductase YrpB (nitropropane dioxygenase family)